MSFSKLKFPRVGCFKLLIVANKIFFSSNHGNGVEQLSIRAKRFIMALRGISMSKNEKLSQVLKSYEFWKQVWFDIVMYHHFKLFFGFEGA